MKILGNYFNPQVNNAKSLGKTSGSEKDGTSKVQQSNVDKVTIGTSLAANDSAFASALKDKLVAEIKDNKSAEDLNALANNISNRDYSVSASAIADKILLA